MAKKAHRTPLVSPPEQPQARPRVPVWRRPVLAPLFLAALLLVATVEERLFGVISDEQQMLFTSVSMAEFGEIGIARGMLFAVHRPSGDAVAPYGMGLSLLQTVPALLAPAWERTFGSGSSQTLFVLTQLALILAAAGAAGRLSLLVGASPAGTWVAVLGTAVGSPLWTFGGTNFSEPIQAAALAGTTLAAALAARERAPRRALGLAAIAGAAAGVALLSKSLNAAVVPFCLAPLVLDGELRGAVRDRLRLVAGAAAGAVFPSAVWLAFEVVRYGAPFVSYGGQNFTHPFLDGLWRLLVGPNKGLFVFFPLFTLSLLGVGRLLGRPGSRGTGLAIGGSLAVLVALASSWWAWDGTVGWGPRFLVPAVPLLAAAAGAAASFSSGALLAGRLLLVAGILVTLPAILIAPSAGSAYTSCLPGRTLTPKEAADYPWYFLETDRAGKTVLPRHFFAASQAHINPIRLHLFLLRVRLQGGSHEELTARLEAPPWKRDHPGDVPAIRNVPSHSIAAPLLYLESGFTWPHLAAAMNKPHNENGAAFATAYLDALADQILRNIDTGKPERSLALAERLFERSPSPYAAALEAEALRAGGRTEGLKLFLSSLPPEMTSSPSLGVVQALAARDAENEPLAREILGQVAVALGRRPGVALALASPISKWPPSLHSMTGDNLASRSLAAPSFTGR